MLQAALAESGRARMLHKARLLNDAQHTVNKAKKDAQELNREDQKHKIIAAAPVYVRRRVERGERLPYPEVRQLGGEDEEEMREGVLRWVVRGEMAKELYYDVMDFIMPRWDDARNV